LFRNVESTCLIIVRQTNHFQIEHTCYIDDLFFFSLMFYVAVIFMFLFTLEIYHYINIHCSLVRVYISLIW